MEFLDLCSGIGGFRLALEKVGFKCAGYSEINKYAVKSYQAMFDTEGEWYCEDITKIRSEEIPKADIWTFGFPCQDISVAGSQHGISGKRSNVYFNIIELIKSQKKENKPRYLLIENVKNLLSINRGFDFARVLLELDEAGYDTEWQVLNSKDFGVPQNRERVYIIGYLRGESRQKILPLRRKNTATLEKIIKGSQSDRVYNINGISSTIQSGGGGLGAKTGLYLIYPILTPDRLNKRQNGRRTKNYDEPMFTLTSHDRHGVLIKEATKKGYAEAHIGDSINISVPNSKTRRGRVGKCISNTLDTGCQMATLDCNCRIRRLTPKECFRLQGFPDELFEKAKAVNSDTQLYKQAGNAVTVNVVYAIAENIKKLNSIKE